MNSQKFNIEKSIRRTGDTIKISGDYQHRALIGGNRVQRFWHYSKQTLISRLLPPLAIDRILDVGCGSGVITGFLGSSGATVIGMDGNLDAIRFAAETYQRTNVTFQHGLVDEHFRLESPLDKIYCMEVIEHIHMPQAVTMLTTFIDNLNPGGKVLLTTPNYHSAWPLIEWAMDRLGSSPKLKDDQHVEHYHACKLRKLCETVGFQVNLVSTSCVVAPWLAAISRKMAEVVDGWEARLPGHTGSILVCILEKKR